MAPSKDGFYVFFERKGFTTSPLGPLPDEECARAICIVLGVWDEEIKYSRIEFHGPEGPKTIREYKQKSKAPTGRPNSRRRS